MVGTSRTARIIGRRPGTAVPRGDSSVPPTAWPVIRAGLALACVLGGWRGAALFGAGDLPQSDSSTPLSIRLTSPLGRTGMTGAVRIVARIVADPKATLGPVHFLVDGTVVGEDTDGPPYAVEWVDQNPFERREIAAVVTDSLGGSARDVIELKPLEIYDTTQVSSVLLEPSVLDPRGKPVNGLAIADFAVTENGEPQVVDLVTPDTIPAVYTLLVDSSQSMSRRMDFVRDAAGQLPVHLRNRDRIVVVPFSRTLSAVTGPTQDRDTISGAIAAIRASGGTAILDCLSQAVTRLSVTKDRHIVVLITDGYDENSKLSFEQALEAIKSTKTTVYVIAIGGVAGISLKGEELLRRLATETGGRAFFPSRDFQLADMHQLIAEDVQQRYVLTYTPTNQKLDGTWRAIRLTAKNPAYTVKVRTGYFAPSPPPVRPQIELTVRDLNRELIDVTPNDLEVFEDGVEQKVDAFEEALSPVSVMLLLDSSGSMRKDAPAVMEAARTFVQALPTKDKLAVMTFSDKPELAHDLTTNRQPSLDAISKYVADGGTALYDAVFDGLARLKRAEGRTALVVFTDGRDENNPGTAPGSVHTLSQVLVSLGGVETTVYAIGLGPKVDRETLEHLASASNGEANFPDDVSRLGVEYRRILENLRRRYVISYSSTNTARDGAWRKVEIRAKRRGLVVDTRGGYFAPESD